MVPMRKITVVFFFIGLLGFAKSSSASCSMPYSLQNGQLADATQVMLNFNALTNCIGQMVSGPKYSIPVSNGTGSLFAIGPLDAGQILVGATGAAPQAGYLNAGPGVSVSSNPTRVVVSGGLTPYTVPKLPNFVEDHAVPGASATDTSTGLALFEPYQSGSNEYIWWWSQPYPTTATTFTVGVRASLGQINWQGASIDLGDSTGAFVRLLLGSRSNGTPYVAVENWSSYTSKNSDVVSGPGVNGNQIFLQIVDDGANLVFRFGTDLSAMVTFGSVSRKAFLTNGPTRIGIGIDNNANSASFDLAATFFHADFGN